jgi:YbbR domain-containing protein
MLTALVIWIQVASSSLLTRDVDLPLELHGLADDATLSGNDWPDVVRVRATGSKWHFFQNQFLGRSLGKVTVDLSDVAADVLWQRDVTVNDVDSPLADVSIQPPVRLTLQLDRIATRKAAVAVAFVGVLPEHRILMGEVTSQPDSVLVSGPSRVLEGMGDAVASEPVDLSRIRGRQTVERALVSPGEDVVLDPAEVSLTFSVLEAGTRVYENVPIVPLVDVDQSGADVFPPVASVEVRGPAEELARMPMSAINLTVALTGLAAGTHTLAPDVLLPERFELMSLEPAQVLVVIGGRNTRGHEGPP